METASRLELWKTEGASLTMKIETASMLNYENRNCNMLNFENRRCKYA